MRLTPLLFLGLVLTFPPLSLTAQTGTPFKMLEPPGPYAVGLRVVEQYDYSRVFQAAIDEFGKPYGGDRARPLQTLIWYPARRTNAKPMTFADYVALKATETSFGSPKQLTGYRERMIASMKPYFAAPALARRDAPSESGQFPVIIYAPGSSSVSWENSDLCEYLVSHGYIVVAAPAMGVTRESTDDVAGTDEQARDISFLIAFARTLPDADLSKIAVVGFSWGGIANLFAAARDDRIGALVALDGSMRYYPGVVAAAKDVHPEAMTIPLLYFEGQHTLEDEARLRQDEPIAVGPNVLNEWTLGDLMTVQMLGLFHPEFISLGQRNELLWKDEATHLQEADYTREDGIVGYGWVARYTRAFLDDYLKHDAAATTFLRNTPSENGVPAHMMSVNFRRATRAPESFASFRVRVGQEGFDHATQIYATVRLEQPDFRLAPEVVDSWAYQLAADRRFPEAVDISRLVVRLDDSSSAAFTHLGEMYTKAGQKQEAIASYERALEKDTANIVAKRSLEQLDGSPAHR
jgi:pimeloyl-ACP methyl ester carboxylesterase